jgi:hypothetical protein
MERGMGVNESRDESEEEEEGEYENDEEEEEVSTFEDMNYIPDRLEYEVGVSEGLEGTVAGSRRYSDHR